MIKGIIKFFKNFYEKEVDYTFEFEFSIYDVALLLLIAFVVFKLLI